MQVTSSGMYTSTTMDLCSGNSGGAVVDAVNSNYLVVIVTGETLSNRQCYNNVFAPSILDQSVNEAGCSRSTGGVAINCLSRMLPA
jgi:hypothetical protein